MKNRIVFLVLLIVLVGIFVYRAIPAKSESICEDTNENGIITVLADGDGECATIQDAVDVAEDGAVITIGDGTYQENVEITGKYLSITGNVDDPSAVILDAGYAGNVFNIHDMVDGIVEIAGVTLTKGSASSGGAIYVNIGALNITDSIFHDNDIFGSGGAIALYGLIGEATIDRCIFYSNEGLSGGAIYATYLGTNILSIKNSLFYDNSSDSYGGAIYVGIDTVPILLNNTFAYNIADVSGGAVYIYNYAEDLDVRNNIFYKNEADPTSYGGGDGGAIFLRSYFSSGTIDYNNFYRNDYDDIWIKDRYKTATQVGADNSTFDPSFSDALNDDYTLSASSSLVDGGADLSSEEITLDVAGDARPIGEGYDLGAYEYGEAEVETEVEVETGSDAEVYCQDAVGTYDSESGMCVFDDGSECEVNAFYWGTCLMGDSLLSDSVIYCQEAGGTYQSAENVCAFDDGSECDVNAFYIGTCLIGDTLLTDEEVYCQDADGTYQSADNVCAFDDGSECDVNEFYTGTCLIGDSLLACGDFPDVNASDFSTEQCAAITWAQDQEIFTGSDVTGELSPSDSINRAETTKVLIEAFGYDLSYDDPTYGDLVAGAWYMPYVMAATREGIVQGYADGSFKPADTVNKVEMLKIVLETAGIDLSDVDTDQVLFSDIPVDDSTDWYRKYAYYAYEHELVDAEEGGTFGAGDDILREDVILVLYRLQEAGLWTN